jgi:nucleotide-binding universal stress UspA family protein
MDGAEAEVADDLRVRAQNAAAADVATLLGAPVNIDVVLGDPVDALVSISDDVDVLVCGARGYGPGRSALLGGVTRQVTAGASCPVVVLARGPGVTLETLVG